MNFLLGGRMGDLIHMLYVVANTPGKHDLFITDRRDLHSDGFIYDLEKTIEELTPVLMKQDYVNSIQAYKDEEVINLNMWRRYAYSASWTNLLSKTFNVPINSEPWIKLPKKPHWANKVEIMHKSVARSGRWCYSARSYFIGTTEEYISSGFYCPHHEPQSLLEMFNIINNCQSFIGNQSLPLAIAHSLGVNRIGILNEVDKAAYIGEEKIYSNFSYVL